MSRLFSRSLAAAFLALAGLASARAEIASVRYLVPVTYDMVITRPGTSTSTTRNGVTTEELPYSFEVFTSKDLLKLILGVSTDADVKGWSLYAVSDSETFTDPDGLETLQLVARKKDGTQEALPEGQTFSLSLSDTRAYSSVAVHDGAADGEVLSKRETITQLATLTQMLPVRGERSAGTLTTTGYLKHGLLFGKVTLGGETTPEGINRPTAATYRAAGTFNADIDSEDGLAEVLISFGTPKLEAVDEEPSSD
jgi:hypothetical protein